MRRTISGIALVAAVAALAGLTTNASGSAVHAAKVKTKKVTVGDDFYSPTQITIKRGMRVKWVWQNGHTDDPHTVTEANGHWSSTVKTSGTYSHRFKKKGTFVAFCEVHPDDMRITVTVKK